MALLRARLRCGGRQPRNGELNAAVLERVPPAGDAPLFLYVHYMDPHSAYSPPSEHRARLARDPGYRADEFASSSLLKSLARGEVELSDRDRRWLIDLYDAEIASVDAAIEELLEALAARGYGSDSVICVVSDHGEEFGEHGGWFHGISLHAESLRVPLILRDPRSGRRGERREEPVDLIDVATTLLRRAGVEPTASMRGRDLLSANLAPRDLVAELHHDPPFEENVAPREQRLAVLRWPWKTILSRTSAAANYRVDHDPHETRPLDAALPADLVAHPERLARPLAARADGLPLGRNATLQDVVDASQLIESNIDRADKLVQAFKNLSARQVTDQREHTSVTECLELEGAVADDDVVDRAGQYDGVVARHELGEHVGRLFVLTELLEDAVRADALR